MKKIRLIKTFGIILSSFLGLSSQAQSISSTLDSRTDVVEDVSSSFEVATTAGTMTGSTVKIFITLSDTNLSSSVHAEYYNPSTSSYEAINFVSGVAQFGPVSGFPFYDATSDFRVVFDSATTYDYTLEVHDSTSTVIASANESVTVNAYVPASISSNLNGRTGLLQSIENDFTIYMNGGNDTSTMIWVNMKLADSTLANSVHLSYFDGSVYQPLFYGMNGSTRIGNVSGVNLLVSDSIMMKVTFDSATTYDYSLEIEDVSNSEILSMVNESVSIGAYIASSISSTLNGRVGLSTGNQDTFSVSVVSGSMMGEMVTLRSQLADSNLVNSVHLEYFDGTVYQPLTYNSDGSLIFGPATGFPLADATTEFRVIFDSATTYDYHFEIVRMSDSASLAISNESVTVGQTISALISSTLNGRVGLSTGNQDTFSVSVISGSMMGEIVNLRSQLADSNLVSSIHLEYFDGTSYQPLTYNSDGSLIFGPAVGFPLADATTEFRITFDSAATYDYVFEIVRVSDSSVLAMNQESVTVGQTIPAVIMSTLNGRTGLTTGVQDTFSISILAGDMSGEMVTLKSQLADSNLVNSVHLEYFDGTTYQPLTYNSDGSLVFGPATGFPLADATTEFRVIFDSATTYNYSFQIIDFNDLSVIAESNESVTVDEYIDATVFSTINGRTGLMVGVQDTFSVSTTAGSEANRMVLISLQLADANLYNSINLEYFDGTTYQSLSFSTGGTLIFGPTGGFPLADATTLFRVTFDSAVTYDYTLSILDATTSDILGSTNESITINSIPVPATISTSLNGRTGVKTNTPVNFIATITANSDTNKTAQLKITLLNAGLSNFVDLRFFDGSTFQTLSFDNNGVAVFGSTGFPIADRAITFNIEFDTATTVDYKFELVEMSNSEVIANSTESVVVERTPTGGIYFNDKMDFAMMPNPANDIVNIDYHKEASVNIYDITGKLIRSAEFSSGQPLNVADLNNGTYYVQLIDGVNFSTKKLVIIH